MVVIESDALKNQRQMMTFSLERNVLGVPTFVLNTKSNESTDVLTHSWKNEKGILKFTFTKTPKSPFPQVEHARYFDTLIGLFATRWNPEGYLYFSVAEALRFSGKDPRSGGNRKAVLEAIRRYQFCQASWEQSWNGGNTTWVGSFIPESDIWEDSTGELKRNPRNSRRKEALHKIRFNEHIVTSLKESNTRVFLTDSIKKLKPDSYAVYRYFYSFSDISKVIRNIENLMNIFPWTGRKSRFQPWLEARLKECLEKKFIASYEFKEGRVYVKCRSLKEHKESSPVIELKPAVSLKKPSKRSRTTTSIKASHITDEAVLEEYYRRKQEGLLEEKTIEALDMMLAAGLKGPAIAALKNRLAKHE